jgi:oligopeptide/dipeptide ABC transporter ATP-binding protein
VNAPLLSARGLSVTYRSRGAVVHAAREVSFDLAPGEILGLVGESGCGKSSVARALVRLVDATGEVTLDGEDWLALDGDALRRARRDVQTVFQDPLASLDPRFTVREALREALEIHHPARLAVGDVPLVAALEAVQLDAAFLERRPHELSGGQCQRVAIARALLVEPRVLVCDEAVSALDVTVRAQVVDLLRRLRDERSVSIVFIAHDLALVRNLCDRVLVMYAGRIVESGAAAALFAAPRHPYTRALLDAVPKPDPAARRPRPLGGEPPSPRVLQAGCSFAPRCAFRVARCTLDAPALERTAGRQVACHRAGEFVGGVPPATG